MIKVSKSKKDHISTDHVVDIDSIDQPYIIGMSEPSAYQRVSMAVLVPPAQRIINLAGMDWTHDEDCDAHPDYQECGCFDARIGINDEEQTFLLQMPWTVTNVNLTMSGPHRKVINGSVSYLVGVKTFDINNIETIEIFPLRGLPNVYDIGEVCIGSAQVSFDFDVSIRVAVADTASLFWQSYYNWDLSEGTDLVGMLGEWERDSELALSTRMDEGFDDPEWSDIWQFLKYDCLMTPITPVPLVEGKLDKPGSLLKLLTKKTTKTKNRRLEYHCE